MYPQASTCPCFSIRRSDSHIIVFADSAIALSDMQHYNLLNRVKRMENCTHFPHDLLPITICYRSAYHVSEHRAMIDYAIKCDGSQIGSYLQFLYHYCR